MLKTRCLSLFIISGLFFVNTSFGQNSGALHISQMQNELGSLMRDVDRDNGAGNGLETVGSPYLDEAFKKMEIRTAGQDVSGAYGRYNAFADRIEIKMEEGDDEVYVMTKAPEVSCFLGGQHFVYKDYRVDSGSQEGYLLALLEEGVYQLFKRSYVYYREGKVVADPLKGNVPNKYVQQESFLIGVNGSVPEEFKMKKRDVLALLSADHQQLAKELLKKDDYNLKRENEVVDFFRQLNMQADNK